MTRYKLETETRDWVNTFDSLGSAIDVAKEGLTNPLRFNGIPKDQWPLLAKRNILTNLTTREEFIVFYDGSYMPLTKYKSL